jgi:hypothetical protein
MGVTPNVSHFNTTSQLRKFRQTTYPLCFLYPCSVSNHFSRSIGTFVVAESRTAGIFLGLISTNPRSTNPRSTRRDTALEIVGVTALRFTAPGFTKWSKRVFTRISPCLPRIARISFCNGDRPRPIYSDTSNDTLLIQSPPSTAIKSTLQGRSTAAAIRNIVFFTCSLPDALQFKGKLTGGGRA